MEKETRSIRPMIYLALATVMVVAVCLAVIISKTREKPVTNNMIIEKIQSASELTSAKMICSGLLSYSDGKIPLINQEAFQMTYSATVKAGINLKKINVNVTKENVEITVPPVTVSDADIIVDENSIKYYDQKFALFKDDSKEDAMEAIKIVKQEILKKKEINQLKQTAKDQIKVIFKGLFEEAIGNKKLIIKFK